MTPNERARGLESLGFTERQARFLTIVALHSGYCLRRQYAAATGVAYGKNVRDFLDSLVERQLAQRFTLRADRGHVYHLHSRTIYRALHQEDNRNRREVSAALIARKLMVLDAVLSHGDVDWLGAEDDKVELLVDRFGVPRNALPFRVYAACDPGGASTTRFFPHKLPVAVVGDPAIVHFLYLQAEPGVAGFEAFLEAHASLFDSLRSWNLLVVGPCQFAGSLAACEAAFSAFVGHPSAGRTKHLEEMRAFFPLRRTVTDGEIARLSVRDINRFRQLQERFSTAESEALYQAWISQGDSVLDTNATHGKSVSRGLARFSSEVLPFDYSQFGSLPGVA